jgi:hypothetical protein
MMMNDKYMAGSEQVSTGFVDSGTTFTYINSKLYAVIKNNFECFCNTDKENHCLGKMDFTRKGYMCFSYDESRFPDGPKKYFESFPILRILIAISPDKHDDRVYSLDWYPSEYLYREQEGRYCVALDISESSYITIGGTMMRQHNFVFDVEENMLGIARATCSEDPNQIFYEQDLRDAG